MHAAPPSRYVYFLVNTKIECGTIDPSLPEIVCLVRDIYVCEPTPSRLISEHSSSRVKVKAAMSRYRIAQGGTFGAAAAVICT